MPHFRRKGSSSPSRASKKVQGCRGSLNDGLRTGHEQDAHTTLGEARTTDENPVTNNTNLGNDSAMMDSKDSLSVFRASSPATERSCPVCCAVLAADNFPAMTLACTHSTCRSCLETYFKQEIMESRTGLKCLQCENEFEAHDITRILSQSENPELVDRYLEFTLRRSLASMPDIRWCPAPDCGYGVIANNCASCPKLTCKRPECGTTFCYLCEREWHPRETCLEAFTRHLRESMPETNIAEDADKTKATTTSAAASSWWQRRRSRRSRQGDKANKEEPLLVKLCPHCRAKISRHEKGCNQMHCWVCSHEFCWLCLQSDYDGHFFRPTGCTYKGSKTWSRPSTVAAQVLAIAGAPLGLAALMVAIPPIVFYQLPAILVHVASIREYETPARKRLAIVRSALTGIVLSPFVAVLGIVLAIPLGLVYAYGYMPYKMVKRGPELSPHRFGIDVDDAELCLYVTVDAESEDSMPYPSNVARNPFSGAIEIVV
ncbi:E3 ubiquitin-protein ligase RNF19A-like [Sycon ciliatum]|uniref:E3 ubiquitin-protein ligase RNF19A-like n=1 Tax=Sycon ciliatum TaxID=27933 RepID=UPI0031F627E1